MELISASDILCIPPPPTRPPTAALGGGNDGVIAGPFILSLSLCTFYTPLASFFEIAFYNFGNVGHEI